MKVWITRDFDDGLSENSSCVNIHGDMPRLSEDGQVYVFGSGSICGFMSAKAFKKEFNRELGLVYCKQHELTLKEI